MLAINAPLVTRHKITSFDSQSAKSNGLLSVYETSEKGKFIITIELFEDVPMLHPLLYSAILLQENFLKEH
ncbi:MAG: hypothetical protein JWQ40_3094 [Segetibacter sp.]|nr:hypothetical protein [Segetibacter sp.]